MKSTSHNILVSGFAASKLTECTGQSMGLREVGSSKRPRCLDLLINRSLPNSNRSIGLLTHADAFLLRYSVQCVALTGGNSSKTNKIEYKAHMVMPWCLPAMSFEPRSYTGLLMILSHDRAALVFACTVISTIQKTRVVRGGTDLIRAICSRCV